MLYIFPLLASVLLSSIRNTFSKGISDLDFGTKKFFMAQSVIFLCGSTALIAAGFHSIGEVSVLTILLGVIYSLLLLSAQYCYTVALKKGNMGICSTVYSLGFILPTLSGSIFWEEELNALNIVGVMTVIATVVYSGISPSKEKSGSNKSGYIFPLIIAMISSGGLGIMQKIQQSSPYPQQRNVFIITAFVTAGVISFTVSLFSKDCAAEKYNKKLFSAAVIGVAFAFSNLLNTFLAGKLPSAVFFPSLNIATILFSLLSGVIFYKEKITRKDVGVLAMGIVSILLLTVV